MKSSKTTQVKFIVLGGLLTITTAITAFAYIEIPSDLSNAVQYIKKLIVSDSWGAGGREFVILNTDGNGGIKIAPTSVQNGAAFNNKALWLDINGNIIYQDIPKDIREKSEDNIYYNSGNVGIGVQDPSEKLEVEGKIRITNGTQAGVIYMSGDDLVIEEENLETSIQTEANA